MIREWRMNGFKSVGRDQRLGFRPLTILAGANSSGKSTVLQSILLVSQTLTSKVITRHLVLNGDLVKLGTFEDVRNEAWPMDELGLGFSLTVDPSQFTASGRYRPGFFYPQFYQIPGRVVDVVADIEFGPSADADAGTSKKSERLQADVVRAALTALVRAKNTDPDDDPEPDIKLRRRSEHELRHLAATASSSQELRSLPLTPEDLRYEVVLSETARRSLREYTPRFQISDQADVANDIVAARLEHFVPITLVERALLWPLILSDIVDELFSAGPRQTPDSIRSLLTKWTGAVGNEARGRIAAAMLSVVDARPSIVDDLFRARYGHRVPTSGEPLADLFGAIRTALGTWTDRRIFQARALPEVTQMFSWVVGQFFRGVRYLGPLRDDPRPVYGIESSADPLDVGPRGQHTAAVLDLNAATMVDFIPPGEDQRLTRAPLLDAVQRWLNHFAIADQVTTREEGKLGHRLLVRPDGISRDLDLTNVGVGVSQVLPIVVMALISEPNALLLFEQPELHLHPAVQSLLGDFFLAVAASGKQCVVETHSEYLINRLRLRVAEAESEKRLQDWIAIHFVERNGPVSNFREVFINEYGAIPAWPEGFFDQGPHESERIIAAARRKKARLRSQS